MKRLLWVFFGTLLFVGEASAHFPFIVPQADGSQIQVVFSDSLEPDEKASIERIAAMTLFAVDTAGKSTPVRWTKLQHALTATLPGKDVLVVNGFTDRGFVQSKHTENKPVWIKHYPKAVIGDVALAAKVRASDQAPLELVPVLSEGQLRFQVLRKGKPLPGAEVTVLVPGDSKARETTTDTQGITKDSFSDAGQYGARAGFVEKAEGVLAGNKYEEIRSYATLVVSLSPAGR